VTTTRHGERRPVAGEPAGSGPPDGAGPGGGSFSYARALALVLVAVVLGAYLLGLGNGGSTPEAGAPVTATTTTTTTTPPSTTATTAVVPNPAVKVLVANASDANGVAGFYTTKLSGAGWGTLTATSASTTETTSAVYYATGQQGAATAIAATLGVPASAVQPLSSAVPVQGTTGASVVVVAGNDLAAKVTPTTATAG
jgi:LytR cell envelope-related transcriptional attenuator